MNTNEKSEDNGLKIRVNSCLFVVSRRAFCGRTNRLPGERYFIAIAAAGIRKTSEPGTHMITPAQFWSASEVVPNRRGTAMYDR
jgi:hypothetical protein